LLYALSDAGREHQVLPVVPCGAIQQGHSPVICAVGVVDGQGKLAIGRRTPLERVAPALVRWKATLLHHRFGTAWNFSGQRDEDHR
jgi:hypothetical protein